MDNSKKPPMLTIVLAILLVIAMVVILVLFLNGNKPDVIEDGIPSVIGGGEPIPEDINKPKDVGVTHLPSYGALTFKAGTKNQDVVLQNPGENSCLICITLTLADGTKIYKSELVEPGYYTKPITLVAPMERGIYRDVVLKYECYTNDANKSPLNGASTKLDITVE